MIFRVGKMKLPDLMKKFKPKLKELERLHKKVVSKENETRRLTQMIEVLESENKKLEEMLFFILFKDLATQDIDTLKFPRFSMVIDKNNERVVFTQLATELWRLYEEKPLTEFLDAVIDIMEKNLTKWDEHLTNQLKRLRSRYQQLKERYELLKGLKAFVSK